MWARLKCYRERVLRDRQDPSSRHLDSRSDRDFFGGHETKREGWKWNLKLLTRGTCSTSGPRTPEESRISPTSPWWRSDRRCWQKRTERRSASSVPESPGSRSACICIKSCWRGDISGWRLLHNDRQKGSSADSAAHRQEPGSSPGSNGTAHQLSPGRSPEPGLRKPWPGSKKTLTWV